MSSRRPPLRVDVARTVDRFLGLMASEGGPKLRGLYLVGSVALGGGAGQPAGEQRAAVGQLGPPGGHGRVGKQKLHFGQAVVPKTLAKLK